jgi:hypothetical protein
MVPAATATEKTLPKDETASTEATPGAATPAKQGQAEEAGKSGSDKPPEQKGFFGRMLEKMGL